MERFLERTSISKYREQFVLKGGLLVSTFVGTQARGTMDIDTTVKGLPVTEEDMTKIINEICAVELDDNIAFNIKTVSEILDEAEYNGLRFAMEAYLDGSVIPLKIDISTGYVITPQEMLYSYKLMFEDRRIPIMVYPIETVLSEKLETLITRSVTNTRMRGFYDIHVLLNIKGQEIDSDTLKKALSATTTKRESTKLMQYAEDVLVAVKESASMQKLWKGYQRKYFYAADYSWDDVIKSARVLAYKAGLAVKSQTEQ